MSNSPLLWPSDSILLSGFKHIVHVVCVLILISYIRCWLTSSAVKDNYIDGDSNAGYFEEMTRRLDDHQRKIFEIQQKHDRQQQQQQQQQLEQLEQGHEQLQQQDASAFPSNPFHEVQICYKCSPPQPKPPRSHHCSVCGTCILKMDHHCPWVGTCIGGLNYKFFMLFLFYTTIGCLLYFIPTATLFSKIFFESEYDSKITEIAKLNSLPEEHLLQFVSSTYNSTHTSLFKKVQVLEGLANADFKGRGEKKDKRDVDDSSDSNNPNNSSNSSNPSNKAAKDYKTYLNDYRILLKDDPYYPSISTLNSFEEYRKGKEDHVSDKHIVFSSFINSLKPSDLPLEFTLYKRRDVFPDIKRQIDRGTLDKNAPIKYFPFNKEVYRRNYSDPSHEKGSDILPPNPIMEEFGFLRVFTSMLTACLSLVLGLFTSFHFTIVLEGETTLEASYINRNTRPKISSGLDPKQRTVGVVTNATGGLQYGNDSAIIFNSRQAHGHSHAGGNCDDNHDGNHNHDDHNPEREDKASSTFSTKSRSRKPTAYENWCEIFGTNPLLWFFPVQTTELQSMYQFLHPKLLTFLPPSRFDTDVIEMSQLLQGQDGDGDDDIYGDEIRENNSITTGSIGYGNDNIHSTHISHNRVIDTDGDVDADRDGGMDTNRNTDVYRNRNRDREKGFDENIYESEEKTVDGYRNRLADNIKHAFEDDKRISRPARSVKSPASAHEPAPKPASTPTPTTTDASTIKNLTKIQDNLFDSIDIDDAAYDIDSELQDIYIV